MPLRIAFGRIAQETHALSPLRTSLDDFRSQHWLEGEELLRRCGLFHDEAPGFWPWAELSGFVHAARREGAEPVPLFSAWAVPSGPLRRDAFDALGAELERTLVAARPLDGVLLTLHGAMGVEGVREPEAELARLARRASGGAKVALTLDLHANLGRSLVEAADVIVPYGTNPHRDHFSVGRLAGQLLARTVRGELRPSVAWRSLPMLLGGGAEVDLLPPMRAIFARARAMERREALVARVLMCHPWNDARELGWSTIVATDGDPARAEALAEELAEACWAVRDVPTPAFCTAAQALEEAKRAGLARRLGVVVMSDTSDVVAAGATGDSTHLVRALHEEGEGMVSYAAIRDPAVARALSTEVGARREIRVGASLDPSRSAPLTARAAVVSSRSDPGFGRRVLLDLEPPSPRGGRVRLVVTEGPPLVMKPSFYGAMGLSLRRADVVVVKSFFPFRLFFLPWARRTIYVRTRGLTDLDSAFGLDFDGPIHPRDPVADWRPTDRRRRAVPQST